MDEPDRTKNTAADAKIALSRRALEKLIKELYVAADKDWQVDLKEEDGLPKILVMVVHKLLAGVREQITAKDTQIALLGQGNMRLLFINEAMARLNEIDEGSNRPIEDNKTHYCNALNDIMYAASARVAVIFFVDGRGLITELYTRGFGNNTDQKSDDYISFLEYVIRAFSVTDYKPLTINSPDDLLKSIRLPSSHPAIQNILALPLIFAGKQQVRGVLYVANKRDNQTFDENDSMMAELFLNEISNVRERKRLTRQLQREKAEQARLLEEVNRTQGQLLQSEKMASVGQLAAGVAHEINNPVGYINSNIGSMQNYINDILKLLDQYHDFEQYLPDDKRQEIVRIRDAADLEFLRQDIGDLVKESIEGVTRVKRIVNNLKDFSRIDEAEWGWADLHQCIDSTLNIAQNEIKYKAEVTRNYGDIPQAWCIASQINQVILNLLVNAAQAIKEHGTITISTQNLENEHVQISVADTGCGIPENIVKRIFDPFFTSKPVGQGTGLGLSLSYGIIKKHRGKIDVTSEVGKGTVFTITLPVKQQEPNETTAESIEGQG